MTPPDSESATTRAAPSGEDLSLSAVTPVQRFLRTVLRIQGAEDPANASIVRVGVALAVAAVAIRLVFWLYTGRVWEDALITVLHSENCARGLGLTHFRVGEVPLHGFTSPLSVLVPLVGDLVRVGFGLSFIKLVGALCGGLAVLYTMGLAIHPKTRLPLPAAALAMTYIAFEHHQILWGMSGMETQIVVAILLFSAYMTVSWQPAALGLSLGLCMLARPDFAFWTVIVGLYALFRDRRQLPKIVGIAVAVYAPWILFTTMYYGSPIPNTILAKISYASWIHDPNLTFVDIKRNVWDRLSGTYQLCTVFQPLGPCFAGHGSGFRAVIHDKGLISEAMTGLAALAGLVAVVKRRWALTPIIGFVAVYAAYYVFVVPFIFGWYVVPLAAMTIFLSAGGLAWIAGLIPRARLSNGLLWVATGLYLAVIVGILPWTFLAERQIQTDIENVVRRPLGEFLGEVMAPDETVGCEPLGYVAYYSGRTVYDWPGLASRKVVRYSLEHPDGRTMNDMLEYFRPDYLVLRFHEYNYLKGHKGGWVDRDYEIVREFQVDPEAEKRIMLVCTNQDRHFLVLKKRVGGASRPGG